MIKYIDIYSIFLLVLKNRISQKTHIFFSINLIFFESIYPWNHFASWEFTIDFLSSLYYLHAEITAVKMDFDCFLIKRTHFFGFCAANFIEEWFIYEAFRSIALNGWFLWLRQVATFEDPSFRLYWYNPLCQSVQKLQWEKGRLINSWDFSDLKDRACKRIQLKNWMKDWHTSKLYLHLWLYS